MDHGISQLARHSRQHPGYLLLPFFLLTAVSLGYAALLYQPQWDARQGLTVREVTDGGPPEYGAFDEAEQLKHAQETFQEVARSNSVAATALRRVGRPASRAPDASFPTAEDVADFQDRIEISAPNGMEFGTTRMFYLHVSAEAQKRAIKLVSAVCDEAERRYTELYEQDVKDRVAELENTVQLALKELQQKTNALQKMEQSAGSDLAELRMLSESFAGGSNLQTTLSEVQQELRQVETQYSASQELLKLLAAAQEDPANLVATPNQLLESQPALRRLKEGLIDAQINTSELLGTMSPEHPRVRAAHVAEAEIRGHLHQELELAVRGLRTEQAVLKNHRKTLRDNTEQLDNRLQRLAGMRAAYSNQLAEVRQQTANVTRLQQELSATRADLAAGEVVALVTRVDTPQTGPYPTGPQRSLIAAAGSLGGLLIGCGILVLTLPQPATNTPRVMSAEQPISPASSTPAATEPTQQTTTLPPMPESPSPADDATVSPAFEATAPQPTAAPIPAVTSEGKAAAPNDETCLTSPLAPRTPQKGSLGDRRMTLKEALQHCSDFRSAQ